MNVNQFDTTQTPMTAARKAAAYRARAKALCVGRLGELLPIGLLAVLLGAAVGTGIDFIAGGTVGYLFAAIGLTGVFGRALLLVSMIFLLLLLPIFFVISLLVSSPLRLGMQRFALNLFDGEDAEAGTLFSYFRRGYGRSVLLNLLYSVLTALPTAVLGAAALIPLWIFREDVLQSIKGNADGAIYIAVVISLGAVTVLIAALTCFLTYSYRFAFTVMAEHPHMGAVEAMRVSRTMMSGHRRRLFLLDLRFIGWSLFSVFTLGIFHAFIAPYRELAFVAFYDELTNRSSAREVMFPSLDFDDYVTEDEGEEAEAIAPAVPKATSAQAVADTAHTENESAEGGMPFTSELFFPSLDPTDYAADDDDGLFHRKRVKRDKPQDGDKN